MQTQPPPPASDDISAQPEGVVAVKLLPLTEAGAVRIDWLSTRRPVVIDDDPAWRDHAKDGSV